MGLNDGIYECVAVFICALLFLAKDPNTFVEKLWTTHDFNAKGTGPLEFHFGETFERALDAILCTFPNKYITEHMIPTYKKMFGKKPKTNILFPLKHANHLEFDDSRLLDEEGIQQYQSLIGSLQ